MYPLWGCPHVPNIPPFLQSCLQVPTIHHPRHLGVGWQIVGPGGSSEQWPESQAQGAFAILRTYPFVNLFNTVDPQVCEGPQTQSCWDLPALRRLQLQGPTEAFLPALRWQQQKERLSPQQPHFQILPL